MAMGRPTKYNKNTVQKVKDYLNCYPTLGCFYPSIAGLSRYLKVSRETIHEWSKEPAKAEFSDIIGILLAEQEWSLCNKGLVGEFNSTVAKLMLTKHGYSDKQVTETKATINLSDLSEAELDRRLQELELNIERSSED